MRLGGFETLIDKLAGASAGTLPGVTRPVQLPIFPQDDGDGVSF